MISGYRNVKETAKLWGITPRRLQVLCSEGRIEGASKLGREWAISIDAVKPGDKRIVSGQYKNWRKSAKENNKIDRRSIKMDYQEQADFQEKKSPKKLNRAQEAVLNAIDVNGDGQIDIEDIILIAFKVPGVSVNREKFLRKEFATKYPKEVIDNVIISTPVKSNISNEDIDRIANSIIQNERLKVSGISAALGAPGGAAMIATIPADIAQYYGCMLRVAQKLLYLYGFPQIDYKENEQTFDTETMNQIILCLGVMFGIANAKNGLLALAKALGKGVEKQLMKKALTKGTIFPIVKSISKWFGVKMTKEVFTGFFKKAIPFVGGAIGGGLTYLTFKPCCEKLKIILSDTYLSNPNYKEKAEVVIDIESGIEVDIDEDSIEVPDYSI